MSNVINRMGYEESILYSDDDYEPYGYASPRVAQVAETEPAYSHFGPHEREIEAAVLRGLDTYPGC